MRQVTGSNQPLATDKVSIQQSLNGHSFSLPNLVEPSEGVPMEVEILTRHTMLVPVTIYQAGQGEQMLAINGLAVGSEECVVASEAVQEQVAIMALPKRIHQLLTNKYGEQVRFTTPLLHTINASKPTLWLHYSSGYLFAKLYHKEGLQLAEVIPAESEEEVCYFLERLDTLYPLKSLCLLTGKEQKEIQRWAGKRFQTMLCE